LLDRLNWLLNRIVGWLQRKEKLPVLVALPRRLAIRIVPVTASTGRSTVTCVDVTAVISAFRSSAVLVLVTSPKKKTVLLAGIGSKLVPVITTEVPEQPDAGLNEVMVGAENGGAARIIAMLFVPLTMATPVVAPWKMGSPDPSADPNASTVNTRSVPTGTCKVTATVLVAPKSVSRIKSWVIPGVISVAVTVTLMEFTATGAGDERLPTEGFANWRGIENVNVTGAIFTAGGLTTDGAGDGLEPPPPHPERDKPKMSRR